MVDDQDLALLRTVMICHHCPTSRQVRLRLGALGRAFSARSEQARVGHEAHQVASAALGLADALSAVRICLSCKTQV